ncbi:putative alpha- -mannosyltransferase [Rosellinia necatrix]|uniref:Putative alpha--mannosyltransferase n=1 Tax=Rosellinia necatrix TaxID=77044 RepID=A0A1W2TVD0_ROSNE|nr:putative alpha- -mannosyltransferase [Rosellinia necatrix]
MLLQPSLGPKEGRLPPGLFSPASSGRGRRLSNRQKHAALFAIVLTVFLVYSIYFRPSVLTRLDQHGRASHLVPATPDLHSPTASGDTHNSQDDVPPRVASRKGVQPANSQKPIQGGTTKDESKPKEAITKVPETKEEKMKEPATESAGKHKPHHQKTKPEPEAEKSHSKPWPERSSLKEDLDAVFALLPDEMNMRESLRPINNGGPERMRELGLRTRAYQKYLGAWEKLHLVEDEKTGETYIRDDIIQYLRGMQEGDDTSLGLSITNTIHNYEAFRGFLAKFARILFPFTAPYFADHMTLHAQFKNAGRGIVLTAGDDQAQYLLTTIYTFRELGCDLPIEIMYLGDADLGEDHRFELEALPGVTTRDISQMVDDKGWKLAGWAIKPFAMLMSSFREVIFIDADSFFLKDPAKLFDDPDYQKTGALFFRDRTIMPESKRRWLLQILPRPIHRLAKQSSWWIGSSGHHQESGVVVVDKWKHFISMLLICRFNGSDRDPRDGKVGVYEMMHGDKETFWIGFLLAGDPSFAFHKGAVGSIGVVEPPNATTKATESKPANDDEEELPPSSHKIRERGDDDEGVEESTAAAAAAAAAAAPETYTICSPQLLHLDVDGTPLWFNGWLLVSKYADRAKRKFAPMESYMREPLNRAIDDDFWELTTDNMCCLTSDARHKTDLGERDLGLLKMMRDRALDVGVMK